MVFRILLVSVKFFFPFFVTIRPTPFLYPPVNLSKMIGFLYCDASSNMTLVEIDFNNTMERPDFVSRVRPPTTTMTNTSALYQQNSIKHLHIEVFLIFFFLFVVEGRGNFICRGFAPQNNKQYLQASSQ